jgi:glyoxylase-like metal-dependent hydrolase (beta-lactamase superfamily II)
MRIDRVITSGLFTLAERPIAVDNNVWLFGDDDRVFVIDAGHDTGPILEGIAGRTVEMILCTHGHNDHIDAARALASEVAAPVALHPADRMLWDRVYPDIAPDQELSDGARWEIGSGALTVLHTPGHSPGSVCFLANGEVFGGDTLFNGGPGATQFEFGDHDQILRSIESRLFALPHETVVLTGHGDPTTIGDELRRMHPES